MTKAKINPNKQYKTRDGREVTDIEISDTEQAYPVTACISGGFGLASFTKFGYYYGKEDTSHLDLIEVKQPKKKSIPKQEPVQVTETKVPEKHLHYDMIVAWAENPKLEMQFKRKTEKDWTDFKHDLHILDWDTTWDYRVKPTKPKMLTIVGSDGKSREYPEPCKVALKVGTKFFTPRVAYFNDSVPTMLYTWQGDSTDFSWLSKGIVHLEEEAAELHAKAMLGID